MEMRFGTFYFREEEKGATIVVPVYEAITIVYAVAITAQVGVANGVVVTTIVTTEIECAIQFQPVRTFKCI